MKTVTITFPEVAEGTTDYDLILALRDAMAEYCIARTSPEHYVARRYSYMDDAFRARKLEHVKRLVKTLRGVGRVVTVE